MNIQELNPILRHWTIFESPLDSHAAVLGGSALGLAVIDKC